MTDCDFIKFANLYAITLTDVLGVEEQIAALQSKRLQLDREITNARDILAGCVNNERPVRVFMVAGNQALVVRWTERGSIDIELTALE